MCGSDDGAQSADSLVAAAEQVATETDLDLDDLVAVLAEPRRRHLVRVLAEEPAPLTLTDLARRVVSRQTEAPIGEVPVGDVDQTAVMLHHVDLPKLAAVDAVDQTADLVWPGPTFDTVGTVIAALTDEC